MCGFGDPGVVGAGQVGGVVDPGVHYQGSGGGEEKGVGQMG